ncbi:IBR half RING-finger domain-containing protein [Phytophthora infestans]|uniref:IBR half RING-finger domain-containing protein n=1 Tax=Phytophthora infestans TaxID=4787 RepID=A0A833T9Z1_PHYIN|nr:IBR half RING-finger domain-containing protein [Phytophthora infestans]
MEVLPTLDELKELAQFEHVVYLDADTIDFVDEDDGEAIEAQLAEVYALEVYREEIRRAEQVNVDEAVALSFYAKEEYKLLHSTDSDLDTDSDDDNSLVLVEISDLECKPPPTCTSCVAPLEDKTTHRVLTCGHLYCKDCIATRCRLGVRDRAMVPAHCCKREFPSDYVKEALNAVEFATYERFLKDKDWRSLDLNSDRDYANAVRQNHAVQCPGCGVGVQKITGCNHMTCFNSHQFCFLCTRKWKTCACET